MTDARSERDPRAAGDRPWSEAGAERVGRLTAELRRRAKDIRRDVNVDPVHDMRTATRRLRTALPIYANDDRKQDRGQVESVLKGTARRLGTVRDLDVLLDTLSKATTASGDAIDQDDLGPLRHAWEVERRRAARRLRRELDRPRFRRVLGEARRLVPRPRTADTVDRVAGRAPGFIWTAFGALLAHEIDPNTADPERIHAMRIAAKQLRYTLEAFEEALEPGTVLIEGVTAVHDAAGEMHDAIVASDRARAMLAHHELDERQRTAIEAFADSQHERAEAQRPVVARALSTVRGRVFREALGRAVASMGHI